MWEKMILILYILVHICNLKCVCSVGTESENVLVKDAKPIKCVESGKKKKKSEKWNKPSKDKSCFCFYKSLYVL